MILGSDEYSETPTGILVLSAPGGGDRLADFLVQVGFGASAAGRVPRGTGRGQRAPFTGNGWHTRRPLAPQAELISRLGPHRQEAAALLDDATKSAAGPWVWWHPFAAFLADFWADVAVGRITLVFAVSPPGPAIATWAKALEASNTEVEHLWSDLQRAALAASDHQQSMVVAISRLEEPKVLAGELAGIPPSPSALVGRTPRRRCRHGGGIPHSRTSHPRTVVPLHIPGALEQSGSGVTDEGLVEALQGFYDEDYYENHLGDLPYRREVDEWEAFFASVSNRIATTIGPRTVLDAGCAIGLLVEGLRANGMDARGFDIYHVRHQPSARGAGALPVGAFDHGRNRGSLRPHHLSRGGRTPPPRLADEGIANICRHADAVLFSSSPEDFDELTHINVRPMEQWARRFAEQGLYRDLSYDASYHRDPRCAPSARVS